MGYRCCLLWREKPQQAALQSPWDPTAEVCAPFFCSPEETTLLSLSAAAQALRGRCCFCASLSLLPTRRLGHPQPNTKRLPCARMCEIQRLSLQLQGKAHHLLYQASQLPASPDEC